MLRPLFLQLCATAAILASLFAASHPAAPPAAAPASPARALPCGVTPKADFVFIIDATSSMQGEIDAVKAGLSGFVSGLQNQNIDARFAVVLFGGAPELVQNFSASLADTTNTFSQISASGAVNGFQNNHNVNPEAGLEAIRIVLASSQEVLKTDHVGGTGILAFRPDAVKNLILVTDEDADLPFYVSNQFPGQAGNEPPAVINATWQAEIDATAQAVIVNNAFVNMLVNTSDAPTASQYGNPASSVSDPDFLNFDPAATLTNLINSGFGNSLEAKVLAAGLIGRAFNITQVNTPNFINNFFAAKVEEIVQANIPPVFVDSPFGTCDLVAPIEVTVGVPYVLSVNAQAPEQDQLTTLLVDTGNFVGAICNITNGQTANATCTLTAVATQVGQTFTFNFVAVDNGTPNLTSNLKVCVKVVEAPLSVTLTSLTARALPTQDARIAWSTAAEIDNAGFNIYRATRKNGGAMIKINSSMIPALGNPFQGENYEWIDENPVLDVTNFYWLEDVNIFGESKFHGPVTLVIPG